MSIVFDMTTGNIRSAAQPENREDKLQDKHPELIPDLPVPALQEFEPGAQPDPAGIHLVHSLLKKG